MNNVALLLTEIHDVTGSSESGILDTRVCGVSERGTVAIVQEGTGSARVSRIKVVR